MKAKRSSKYDFLKHHPNHDNGKDSKTWKDHARTVWKYVRIILMLLLAALSFTGFIQSCVLKSSSTVGSGIELYNDKSKIAPYVNNFQIKEKEIDQTKYDQKGNQIIKEDGTVETEKTKIYALEPLLKENFLVTDKTIERLIKKWGDDYGSYNNQSSSLRILDLDGNPILNPEKSLKGQANSIEQLVKGTNNDDLALFMNTKILKDQLKFNNSDLDTGQGNNDSSKKDYQPQNLWNDLNFFVVKRPENLASLPVDEQKVWARGIPAINTLGAFQAYEQGSSDQKWRPVQIENAQYVTYDVDGDGINDTTSPIQIKDPKRIAKFKFGFSGEVVTLSKDTNKFKNRSAGFARDFIQSVANAVIQFKQIDPLVEKVKTTTKAAADLDANARFNQLSKQNLEKLFIEKPNQVIDNGKANKLLSYQERDAILTYQNEVISLLNQFKFNIKEQVYQDEPAKPYDANQPVVLKNNFTDPYEVEFSKDEIKRDTVVGAAPIEQKTITTWGEAWGLGPFYGLVVWPLSFIMNGLVTSMPPMDGWGVIIAIFIAVIAARVFGTLISYKSIFLQHKQQMLNPKKAKIDAKYEPHKGNKQMEQRKRQELADLYRKNNISMSSQFFGMLLSMPIFLAMWRVIQGIVGIKSTTWLGIQFSAVSWQELFAGSWQYLPLMLVAILFQVAAQVLPRYLNKKRMKERVNVAEKAALKKANKVQNIMMVVFIVMPVIFEAGVQIYWIVGAMWQIFMTLFVHWIIKTDFYKNKLHKYV